MTSKVKFSQVPPRPSKCGTVEIWLDYGCISFHVTPQPLRNFFSNVYDYLQVYLCATLSSHDQFFVFLWSWISH